MPDKGFLAEELGDVDRRWFGGRIKFQENNQNDNLSTALAR